ncbi:unnamed protein product [Closterium sp. Naga37s-1]|nr:unnamed protein product [Closterium sp. Naga37s-1]
MRRTCDSCAIQHKPSPLPPVPLSLSLSFPLFLPVPLPSPLPLPFALPSRPSFPSHPSQTPVSLHQKENVRQALLLRGTRSSAILNGVMSDVHHLKRFSGGSLKLSRANEHVRPFEAGGEAPLEQLAKKTDSSLFMFASHSKKRPHNLVMGRMYDYHLYDMLEVGVTRHVSIQQLKGGGKLSPQVGSKPCFCFIGTEFDSDPAAVQLKSLLLDFFRGEVAATVDLAGLDRVFVCAAQNGKVLFRHCAIRLKRSGTKVPRVVLVPIGPSIDFEIRRTRLPGEELRKEAMRAVKLGQEKKIKNVKSDIIKGKVGRIYMPKQEVGSMSLMKMKGLKRERREAAATRKKAKQDAPAKGGEGRGVEAADGGVGVGEQGEGTDVGAGGAQEFVLRLFLVGVV